MADWHARSSMRLPFEHRWRCVRASSVTCMPRFSVQDRMCTALLHLMANLRLHITCRRLQ